MNKKILSNASDIPQDNWVDRWLPCSWRAYARLARIDRPIGTWLLYLPCLWGIALAWQEMGAPFSVAPLLDILQIVLLFAIGAFVMRGAGCTLNDLWDRKIDSQVARTANRPLASGAVMTFGAIIFLAAQLSVGLVILLQLNPTSWVLGSSVLPLVIFYPGAKRLTYWPQAVLGLTFNWGTLLGFVAVKETISPAALLAYAAGFFWTLGYDTIYAYQDKKEDRIAGVRSLALLLDEEGAKPVLGIFYALTVFLLIASVWHAGLGPIAYIGVFLSGINFAYQIWDVDLDNPLICLQTFLANRNAGMLIFLAITLG
ncbi:4-hydroxybenzoate polyprenyl transferase [Candidatus Endolissoclinum faulkneri L2]|uniref:4-hydroxybenzoate octaprenyltransferase n=1 Tax=Candidatus Endolissoclinum faulkneri L2 TaxID=1193729 RepID=K7YG07_9PROT|nr:4-hydroxybenzoate octaprenyltransferase [Candidatus Endolissoclinum faulkneri]AFX98530.1 4-hydroxybenzoate polyprenyl transferase [Candidatus Endolissoclinum faulkneri L2]